MNYKPEELLKTAIEAAHEAGVIQRRYHEQGFTVAHKDLRINLVTDADKEAERRIVEVIRKRFPDHKFVGEEGSYEPSNHDYQWIIDPIDGTANYAKRIPHFCVSIAAAYRGTVVAGVVYDTYREELFSAVRGLGALLNGQPIHVNDVDDLRDAVMSTGFSYDRGPGLETYLNTIRRFFASGLGDLRRFGSAALDLCYVACGRFEGFWEPQLNPWDFAAGALIAREAGGSVTDSQGRELGLSASYIVASNKHLHAAMLKTISAG